MTVFASILSIELPLRCVLPVMRTAYHIAEPIHLTHQAIFLAVGDQPLANSNGAVAQHRGGES